MLLESFDRLNGKVLGGIAINIDGEILSSESTEVQDIAHLEALGRQAIEAGEAVAEPTAFLFAHPATFGSSDETVGAIVVQWSDDSLRELDHVAKKFELLVIVAARVYGDHAAMGFALRRIIAVPLQKSPRNEGGVTRQL